MEGRLLVLACVVLLASAGGFRGDGMLTIRRNRVNTLNFACGAFATNGQPIVHSDYNYDYSFTGLPRWMSARGSTVECQPPANEAGPWYVAVNYRGRDDARSAGTALYQVSIDDSAGNSDGQSQAALTSNDGGDLVGQSNLISSWTVSGREGDETNPVWWTKSGAVRTVYAKPGTPMSVTVATTKTTTIKTEPIIYSRNDTNYVVLVPVLNITLERTPN